MKQFVATITTHSIVNGKIEKKQTRFNYVCASTKSINNAEEELKRGDDLSVVTISNVKDFYLDKKITDKAIYDLVVACNVPEEYQDATVMHILDLLDRGVCFERDKKSK